MNIIFKTFFKIFYIIRRNIPKRVHKNIGNLIKKKTIFKNLFTLPYGIIILRSSKDYYRLVPLRHKFLKFPIIILDIQVIDALYEVFIENSYEKYNTVKPGDIIIDIGANVGLFAIKAAQNTKKNGLVIAIEPEPKNIKALKYNLGFYQNSILVPKALGKESGEINLKIGQHAGAHTLNFNHHLNLSNKEIIKVSIDTLDNIVREFNLSKIDFVKIDVEGWELEVLKGALHTLNMIKFFTIAAYHKKEDNFLITEFLKSHNFKVINNKEKIYAWNENFLKKNLKFV